MPHIHQAIDFTAGAYIVYEQKVLLVLHKKLTRWLPVGGHIELHEDPEEALLREIREESGLTVALYGAKPDLTSPGTKFLYPPVYLDIHDIEQGHRHIGMVYFAKAANDHVLLAEAESTKYHWFTAEELDDPTYDLPPAIKFYAREALHRVGEKATST
jgi:8-oxo-dGTP pyrophosphatase MutT (NUDIX family)